MPITILKVPNLDSRSEKIIIFEHKEGMGEFREKLRKALLDKLIEKYVGLGNSIPCWDELFADIQADFQLDQPCHWQTLDLDLLVRHIPGKVNIKPEGPPESK